MRRFAAAFALTLVGAAVVALAPAPARAQAVQGVVVLPDSVTPAAGVIIEARTAEGGRVSQTVTAATGQFHIALPAPGAYTLRGLQIGRSPTVFGSLTVAAGETRTVRWVLLGQSFNLREVRIVGAQVCGRRSMTASAVSTMLEEMRKAIDIAQFGAAASTTAEWTLENQMATLEGVPTGPIVADLYRAETRSPFKSLSADSLARVGYGVADSTGWTFYGPDLEVLVSDAFVDGHCFRTVRPPRDVDREWVGLAFEPTRARNATRVDIAGTIWLHRATAELQRVEFRYTNLPNGLDVLEAGGAITFRKVTDDLWLVEHWNIRMPSTMPDDPFLVMMAVRGADGERLLVPRATALKTVTGRVRAVRRGDALLYGTDSAASVAPATVTAEQVAALCPSPLAAGMGVLWGVVRDSLNEPVGGGTVEIEWDAHHRWAGPGLREWQSLGRSVPTSSLGLWVACDIPQNVSLSVYAARGPVAGIPVAAAIPLGTLGYDVRVTLGTRPVRPTGRRVSGVVFDSLRGGGPVPDADVRVIGTTRRTYTDSLGAFAFDDLPDGDLALTWRDVGNDVLGIAPPVAILRGEDIEVVLATPSPYAFAAVVCEDSVAEGMGVLRGEVVDVAGRPRPGVVVTAQWSVVRLSADRNDVATRMVRATSDDRGRYVLCGVPLTPTVQVDGSDRALVSGDLDVVASGGGWSSGHLTLTMDGAGAMRRDIVVSDGRTEPLQGRVLGPDSLPVANATVMLLGEADEQAVRTDAAGAWTLPRVPIGTVEVLIRALGYVPVRRTLDPVRGRLTLGDVRLQRLPQDLDETVIVGQRRMTRRAAFEERCQLRSGTCLNDDALSRLPLTLSALQSRIRRAQVAGNPPNQRLMLEVFSGFGTSLCAPRWFVDGAPYGANVTGDEQQSLLARATLLEVYRAWDAPTEFTDFDGCGAVVVWTDDR